MRKLRFLFSIAAAALLGGAAGSLSGLCGPFTDTAADGFCSFVQEIFYLAITSGTTATTYSPGDNASRLQMAAFLSRSVDRSLQRASRRAALGRFWSPKTAVVLGKTALGGSPNNVRWDGQDVWVPNRGASSVARVRTGDGRLLQTWTGASVANDAVVAMGRIFVDGYTIPGRLYQIDPAASPGAVTVLATNLGDAADGIAFDGGRIWTANQGASVSIATPGATLPWTVTTVTLGSAPTGIVFDGANMWVTDFTAGALFKLSSAGAVLQTVTLGGGPAFPVFDGTNIWVPLNTGASTVVVRASSGAVLGTLTGNGQTFPNSAAFDGERVLVTNYTGNTVSLWKTADLTSLGSVPTGASTLPVGACSDGISFWVTLSGTGQLARF